MKKQPIFITGAERSGASLIARIVSISGEVFTGYLNGMYENWKVKQLFDNIPMDMSETYPFPRVQNIPMDFKAVIEESIRKQGYRDDFKPWMFKESCLSRSWEIWNTFYPDAKWIIVRRKPTEITNSCIKTTYMKLFKDENVRQAIGVTTEEEGWQWWIHRYEEQWMKMMEAGLNIKVIWPDRMVDVDYSQVRETLDWLGLRWNNKIIETIDPLINKRRK